MIAQVCFTVLACWLASGIVFGFAALKSVLIDQGIYRELCTADELRAGVSVCYEQDLKYLLSVRSKKGHMLIVTQIILVLRRWVQHLQCLCITGGQHS